MLIFFYHFQSILSRQFFKNCRGSIDMIVVDGVTLPAKSHVSDLPRSTYLRIGWTSCIERCTTLPISWIPYSQGQRERLFRSSHGKFTSSKDLRCHWLSLWIRLRSVFLIVPVQCSYIIVFVRFQTKRGNLVILLDLFQFASDSFTFLPASPSRAKIVQQTGATIVLSSEWRPGH